jgi:hypothetical protein
MRVPLGIFGMQLFNDARAYLRAADILIRDRSPGIDAPTYFLMSHALELILKAYLVARGGFGDDELRDLGHDIEWAYAQAASMGLRLEDERTVALIRLLSDFHKSFVFRYPIITRDDGSLVVRGTLVLASDVLSVIGGLWMQLHGTILDARLSAARQGEYPIETWHMG